MGQNLRYFVLDPRVRSGAHRPKDFSTENHQRPPFKRSPSNWLFPAEVGHELFQKRRGNRPHLRRGGITESGIDRPWLTHAGKDIRRFDGGPQWVRDRIRSGNPFSQARRLTTNPQFLAWMTPNNSGDPVKTRRNMTMMRAWDY